MTATPGTGPALDGRVAWSVDLPEAHEGHVAVAPDGLVVVSSRRFLATVHPTGTPGWMAGSQLGLLQPPVLLPGGAVARYEDGVLVTRELASGATVGSASVPRLSGLAPGPLGRLLYVWMQSGVATLREASVAGEVRWSQPLSDEMFTTVCQVGDEVVVADGPALRGYDRDGRPRWTADRQGFRPRPDAVGTVEGQVHGPLEVVPGGRVLAELTEPDGHGLYLVDPAARTVARVSPPVAVRRPLAVVPDAPPRLAAVGPDEEVEAGRWRWTVLLADLTGTLRWSRPVEGQPQALLAAGAGRVVAVCSPPVSRFADYHAWYDLSDECFVRCFGPLGEELWTWRAPVPLSYAPAVGPDGTVYVAGPGRLWALHGSDATPGRPTTVDTPMSTVDTPMSTVDTPMSTVDRRGGVAVASEPTCRFVQDNQDRRRIFALVTGGGPALGFGPLALDKVYDGLYLPEHRTRWHPQGDPDLGAALLQRPDQWHDLDDFFRFYGYPPEVVAWVESTPPDGRDWREVAARLNLDAQRLWTAAMREAVVEGSFDPAGDPLYQQGFSTNWAVGDPAGQVSVNPRAYRFKAWLSLDA